jgi:hypothetical protein
MAGRIQSVIVRFADEGLYTFPGRFDGHDGNFRTSDGTIDLAVDLNSSFIDILFFGQARPTSAFQGTNTVSSSGIAASVGFASSECLSEMTRIRDRPGGRNRVQLID